MIDDFPLKRAIDQGFLRKYSYNLVPIDVYVSDDYVAKHGVEKSIDRAFSDFADLIDDYAVQNSFSELVEGANRLLIYSGRTKIIAGNLVKSIQSNRGDLDSSEIRKFTSDETTAQREQILDDFKSSIVKILVAIKCLDEGVNLPIADTAMMALSSEDDDRQWIQRRGRILRRIRDEDKLAKIIDFYPVFHVNNLAVSSDLQEYQGEQFRRIQEFAATATPESRRELVSTLREIKE
jgi:superfamily II DNA or RNA helicase